MKIKLDTASPETLTKFTQILEQIDPTQSLDVQAASLLKLVEGTFAFKARVIPVRHAQAEERPKRQLLRPRTLEQLYIHGDVREDGLIYCGACAGFFTRHHFEECREDLRENFKLYEKNKTDLGPRMSQRRAVSNIFAGAAYTFFLRQAQQAHHLELLLDSLGVGDRRARARIAKQR